MCCWRTGGKYVKPTQTHPPPRNAHPLNHSLAHFLEVVCMWHIVCIYFYVPLNDKVYIRRICRGVVCDNTYHLPVRACVCVWRTKVQYTVKLCTTTRYIHTHEHEILSNLTIGYTRICVGYTHAHLHASRASNMCEFTFIVVAIKLAT